ncbi:chorismate mutase [Thermostilla marina]
MLMCRGVRGATTADDNTSAAILQATRELLALMIRENDIRPEEVACIFFTTSPDLNSQFPALAARQLGWMHVPLLCGHEMGVPGSLEKCIRILILWNTEKTAQDIVHVYVKGAEALRPDLSSIPPVDPQELEAWIADRFPDEAS